MFFGGAADCSTVQRLSVWAGRSLAGLLIGAWVSTNHAVAEAAVDCASINMGRLDVALASDSSTVRTVEMNQGDTLAFAFRADTRATGTITLILNGREQRLLYGPHATQVSYTAAKSGAVRFRLATKGGKIATFITTCSPVDGPGAMTPHGLKVDLGVPLMLGATASNDGRATGLAAPGGSSLQWLGGEAPGKETSTDTYGLNLKLQPALTVGVRAQAGQTSDPWLGPAALSEQHWLAGPAMSVLLGAGLSLDARAAWGSADPNAGQPVAHQTFDARLTGKQEAGPWRFSPSISYAHSEARLGVIGEVAGRQEVESGRIDVRPEMAYRIDLGEALYIEPKFMVGTFWTLGDVATGGHDPRPMAETGITFGTSDGTRLEVGGAVQEGETPSDTVWTGRMQLNIPLK